ncbi:MAG: Dabb family protein [Clostridia bacterium]|nr:Dabb family protein [Clostridia bacterium]
MIRHIVMWKYKAELSLDDRNTLFEKLSVAAENMNGSIKGLIKAELIKNVNPQEKYDLCLYCEFETLEDINSYQEDPVHIAFKDIIMGNVFDRACIDAI